MIDVVIVNWNAGLQLKACVESVSEFGAGLVGQIIVVDNGSTDHSMQLIENVPLVHSVLLAENAGFARGCNQGALHATSPYILFLNPDAAIYADTLPSVIACMESSEHRDTGICGVRLLDEQGHVARSCSRYPSALRCAAQSLGLDKFAPRLGSAMTEWDHLQNRYVDQVIGAFFLVRRDLFIQLDGFDERFFVYYEEVDFAYRAAKAGFRSYYLNDTSAFHLGGGVSNQVKARRLFYTLRSRLLYAVKHFSILSITAVVLSTLLLEPLTRLALALLKRSGAAFKETLSGFVMLYRWLPQWLLRGKTR